MSIYKNSGFNDIPLYLVSEIIDMLKAIDKAFQTQYYSIFYYLFLYEKKITQEIIANNLYMSTRKLQRDIVKLKKLLKDFMEIKSINY